MNNTGKIEAPIDDTNIIEIMGFDKWPRDIALAFDRALGDLSLKYLKSRKNRTFEFGVVVADFRALEAQYLDRFLDNEENRLELRRIITEYLLRMAKDLGEPFEACELYWQDLLKLGFSSIEREGLQTGAFAACCLSFGRIDLGLAVVDPLVAKLQRLNADPAATEQAREYYAEEIDSFRKLRARLEAERT